MSSITDATAPSRGAPQASQKLASGRSRDREPEQREHDGDCDEPTFIRISVIQSVLTRFAGLAPSAKATA
jgi:hypothetical protein